MTYYLKYRPQKISELDLESVRFSLEKIVKAKNIPHAFLFAGPRGTGKTSAARILAKVVNCEKRGRSGEPCNKCKQCKSIVGGANIDVVEIDAASHRGIDDVRALRDAVKLAPASAKKKVYIIDEAHMLTTEASNALLKTLEEPPSHAMFILATTNPEKLIGTIRSRVTIVSFAKANEKEVLHALKRVARGERLKPGKGVLEKLAKFADGSFRDAIKVLEQLSVEKKLSSLAKTDEYLSKSRFRDTDKFVELLVEKSVVELIQEVEKVADKGVTMVVFVEGVVRRLQSAMHANMGLDGSKVEGLSQSEVVELIKLFMSAAKSLVTTPLPTLPVEIAIVQWCAAGDDGSGETEKKIKVQKTSQTEKPPTRFANKKAKTKKNSVNNVGTSQNSSRQLEDSHWSQILASIRPVNSSTEALLRAAKPVGLVGNTLKIAVFYKFHKERLEEVNHMRLLEEAVTEVLGGDLVKVECELAPPPKKIVQATTASANVVLSEPEVAVQDKGSVQQSPSGALTDSEDEGILDIAKDIFGS